ncbi:zinc ABC transporter substrate-binding protein [Synechococcus sp. CS-1325]|nr:zinc ABC transporter substrate-binding protein [Synechococcus sp. CS-1325]PZU98989.1 MAG: zinc transporter substrate-binding protein [Cyanobium sp.]
MRIVLRPMAVLTAAALLASCTRVGQGPATSSAPELQVVTTFLPITEFTRAVAGDCATVQALIPANVGPHDFQATPSDLVRLQNASVLVKNGLGLEEFLDKLISGAGNAKLKVIDSSAGIATLANPEQKPESGHDHAHDHGHDHGPINPHIWLDPLRAVQQVETIRDGLIAAKPACKEQFTANAASFSAQLRALDAELAARLKPFAGKTFVAFHDFAPYFADRYKLSASFVVEAPEENPSPADLQRVARQVKQSDLKALLSEPQEGSRSFNALAADLGVRVSVFDPLETGPAEADQPGYYAAQMRRNVNDLVGAFGS